MPNEVDIKENDIYAISPELLHLLLRDNTMSTKDKQVNIFWATDNYASRGDGYQYNDQIKVEAITGGNGDVIKPRSQKCREQQQKRSRQMAEVFTPSWVCNFQNNIVDKFWFEREETFNKEFEDANGRHTWEVNPKKVTFPKGKRWMDYVKSTRLEITCGEAPYLVSRYDTVTAEPIDLKRRIGILDRKLRVVGENTKTREEWIDAAKVAFQNTYGYEWQGDNLVLAREALLFTFIEYYEAMFGEKPELGLLMEIANIISWNIWQMDGLKCVIPGTCSKQPKPKMRGDMLSLFSDDDFEDTKKKQTLFDCPGCKKKGISGIREHNGIYAKIMDWEVNEPLRFVDLMKQ